MGGVHTRLDRRHGPLDVVEHFNRLVDRDNGNGGEAAKAATQIRWTRFDGATPSVNGSGAGSGKFTQVIRNTAGNHWGVLFSAVNADAEPSPTNAIVFADDAGCKVGSGKLLRLYGPAGTNYGQLVADNTGLVTLSGLGGSGGGLALGGHLLFSPDATYDIGASGATRPRVVYPSSGVAVGTAPAASGALRLASAALIAGRNAAGTGDVAWAQTDASNNLILGDSTNAPTSRVQAATDVRLRVGASDRVIADATNTTLTTHLKFTTDNLYDIGALGASRPHDVYIGNVLNVGGVSLTPVIGSWTPTTGATSETVSGRYCKIGRLVTVWATVTVNTIGPGSLTTISGLPYSADRVCAGTVTRVVSSLSNFAFLSCYAFGTDITFDGAAAAGGTTATFSLFKSGTTVEVHATYETAT